MRFELHQTCMNHLSPLRTILIVILLMSMFGTCLPESQFEPRTDSDAWEITPVDTADKTGLFTSLKVNSASNPVVVYHSEGTESLFLYDGSTTQELAGTPLGAYVLYTMLGLDAVMPYQAFFEEEALSTYGTFTSLELSGNQPIVVFHNYDYTYKTDLRALLNITDPQEQQEKFQEIMSSFLFGNSLVLYNGQSGMFATVDVGGGLYGSLELDDKGEALIAYASYISESFRDLTNVDELFSTDDITGDPSDTPDEEALNFYPPFYPTFTRIDLATMQPVLENPVTIELLSDKDMGVSIELKRIDDTQLACAYLNVTDMQIHVALSSDQGVSWQAAPVTLPHRVDDFVSLDSVALGSGTTRMGLAYYNIEDRALYYVYSDDYGTNWSNPIAIDDPPENRAGWYPDLIYLADGTALFSYYFSTPPRSLQFAALAPDLNLLQEQIDTESCSNGRFSSIGYDSISDTIFISYLDKCYNDDTNYAMKIARRHWD